MRSRGLAPGHYGKISASVAGVASPVRIHARAAELSRTQCITAPFIPVFCQFLAGKNLPA